MVDIVFYIFSKTHNKDAKDEHYTSGTNTLCNSSLIFCFKTAIMYFKMGTVLNVENLT